jgi:hypothetical protein
VVVAGMRRLAGSVGIAIGQSDRATIEVGLRLGRLGQMQPAKQDGHDKKDTHGAKHRRDP